MTTGTGESSQAAPTRADDQTGERAPAGKALIAGGGIGGVTAALCLAGVGWEVAVFEQAAEFGEVGAGIQLSPNASRVLHHLGLAPRLDALGFQPQGTEFRHWRTGRLITRAPLGDAVREAYGFPYYHIHRGDLLRLLVEAAEAHPRVALHAGVTMRGFEEADGQVRVTVGGAAGEASHAGAVLVGADGIHSTVRAGLFGAEAPTFTGNVAWRALVPVERLPGGVAPVAAVWWGPHRHFVHYLVRGGTLVNCVCVVEKTGWEQEGWTERGERAELKADFAGWHDNIQTLIDCTDAGSLYKWALHDRAPLARWGAGRVTLLGDACHPMLPFMAQGAAMAVEDAAVLAGCLDGAHDTSAALQRYAALRRDRTAAIQRQSRRNAKLFHLSGLAAFARNRAASRGAARSMAGIYGYDALRQADEPLLT